MDEDNRLLDVETYLTAAQVHGENSHPDHEVGDLQELLRFTWSKLTPEQKLELAKSDTARELLVDWFIHYPVELEKLH